MNFRNSVFAFVLFSVFGSSAVLCQKFHDDMKDEFWLKSGQNALKKVLYQGPNLNQAKNVIVFIGDGMGVTSVTAARIYKGQKFGARGEETQLVFEKFPHTGLLKTYNVDSQVPDSAGSATAIFSGIKTNIQVLGLSPSAVKGNCNQSKDLKIESMLSWAQETGRSTGIVTTTRVTHATPAALYAHVPNRDWECDTCKPDNALQCKDIARQLVEDDPGRNLNVMMGGGRRNFLTAADGGKRKDEDLIRKWKEMRNSSRASYVSSVKDLRAVDADNTDYLLGLFSMDHVAYELDRQKKPEDQPSLKEMTITALRILKNNPQGFFLHVEGGRIDHAHHDSNAKRAFEDTLAFEDAILEAMDLTDISDTLIVVTADHSHVLTLNGYPERGADILGFAGASPIDQHPYTTIMYTTGPGFVNDSTVYRSQLKNANTTQDDYKQLSLVPMTSETHGGEDVAVYARGPHSHLFTGVQEQSYVAHAISYASCMGPENFLSLCRDGYTGDASPQASVSHFGVLVILTYIMRKLA